MDAHTEIRLEAITCKYWLWAILGTSYATLIVLRPSPVIRDASVSCPQQTQQSDECQYCQCTNDGSARHIEKAEWGFSVSTNPLNELLV